MPEALNIGTMNCIDMGGRAHNFFSLSVDTKDTSARNMFSTPPGNLRIFHTMADFDASYLALPVETCHVLVAHSQNYTDTYHYIAFGCVVGYWYEDHNVKGEQTGGENALDRDARLHSAAAVFVDSWQHLERDIYTFLTSREPSTSECA